jgi:hypothetical protein
VWCPDAIGWQASRQTVEDMDAEAVVCPASLVVGVGVSVALGSDAQFEPP